MLLGSGYMTVLLQRCAAQVGPAHARKAWAGDCSSTNDCEERYAV